MTARTLRMIAASLLAMLLLAGCGGADHVRVVDVPDGGEQGAVDLEAAPGGVEQAEAELLVRMEEVAGKDSLGFPLPRGMRCTRSIPASCVTEVTCPAEASDGEAADVCRWLAAEGERILREQQDPVQACTMQYGGPELLFVSGTINGATLDEVRVGRSDGCGIARFASLAPLYEGTVTPREDEQQGDDPDGIIEPPDTPVSNEPHRPDVIEDPPEAFDR